MLSNVKLYATCVLSGEPSTNVHMYTSSKIVTMCEFHHCMF